MGEERSTERIDQLSKAGPFQPEALLGSLSVEGASVVDVGTGGGLWALEAARQGARQVVAVDRNAERVDSVARRAAELGLGVTALWGTAERLPLDSATMDVAIAALVLHEVPDLAAALTEIGRVLNPGGRLLVLELSDGHAHHPRVASPSLRGLLKTLGFEEETFEERDGWYSIVAHKGALS